MTMEFPMPIQHFRPWNRCGTIDITLTVQHHLQSGQNTCKMPVVRMEDRVAPLILTQYHSMSRSTATTGKLRGPPVPLLIAHRRPWPVYLA
jgi:hypothetical protein